jgi:hypothetical protein
MMEIKVENGKANVYTPYNTDFVKRVKGIGGAKWNDTEKCWTIPETAVEVAREIINDVYGYSDVNENETVTLKLAFNERVSSKRSDVVLFGKILAHAYSRDSGARVGDDVAYISGGATSGGSRNNWESVVKDGSVVILSNVNKSVYEKTEIEYDIIVGVIENKNNKKSLLEEKKRLQKRIEEIEKLLQEEE